MSKTKSLKFLMWDEKAIRTKKKRNKGSHVNQLERMYFVMSEELALVYKKRKHYSGTSHGDCIGPIIAPAWDETCLQILYRSKSRVWSGMKFATIIFNDDDGDSCFDSRMKMKLGK